jgi:hypothetical protein
MMASHSRAVVLSSLIALACSSNGGVTGSLPSQSEAGAPSAGAPSASGAGSSGALGVAGNIDVAGGAGDLNSAGAGGGFPSGGATVTGEPAGGAGAGGVAAGGSGGMAVSSGPKQKVLDYFASISGKQTIFGVENKGTPHGDTDHVKSVTLKQPGFWGNDFGFGGAVGGRTAMGAEAVKQWNAGAVVALMYHACAPTRDENCSWDDVGGANPQHLSDAQWTDLVTPGTDLYKAWIGRLDALSVVFKTLKDAGVAPLFRPFHEMNQCVFWWSCHKGENGSLKLYQITHDYLTNDKGFDNIIWVWNVQDFNSLSSDVTSYNPGTRYFDIASLDVYNTGYTSGNYNAMLGAAGDKPIAIGECQFMPSLDILKQQPKWLYAMLWPDFYANNPNLSALYNSDSVLTEDEMPGWK